MSQKPTYLQLEAGEDIPSVRDRLSFIRGQRVLLIWPEEGTALNRKLDLVLVQREAKRRVVQLAFVTHDPLVIEHATELGISTFETIKEAENGRWKRGRTRVFIQRHHKPEESPEPEELMPVASRVRKPGKPVSAALTVLLRIAVLSVVLGTILGTSYVIMPSADVELVMAQQVLSVDTIIIADQNATDVDVENGVIPATRYSVTVYTEQRIPTTGRQPGANSRAIGTISISNISDSPISLPTGTRVSTGTAQAITFETTRAVTVPAKDSVELVPISAMSEFAGQIGNVDASAINTLVDNNPNLTVLNILPTTGGRNEIYNVVTAEDMDSLMGTTKGALQALAYSALESELSESQIIILETLHIPEEELRGDWITFSHEAGEVSDTLTLSMRAVVRALAIDDRLAQQIVFAQISRQRPEAMSINPESFLYLRGAVIETDYERTSFNASGEAIATAQLDMLRLQNDLTGRSLEDAQRLIAATVDIEAGTQPRITIWPDGFGQMPFLPVRIQIITENQR
jgi:hypothetical protein